MSERIGASTVEGFLGALASESPTPGGGAVAAVAGATGAALVAMVCHLTLGRQGYEEVEARLRDVLGEADGARTSFLELADRDDIYNHPRHPYTLRLLESLPSIQMELRQKEVALREVRLQLDRDEPLRPAHPWPVPARAVAQGHVRSVGTAGIAAASRLRSVSMFSPKTFSTSSCVTGWMSSTPTS